MGTVKFVSRFATRWHRRELASVGDSAESEKRGACPPHLTSGSAHIRLQRAEAGASRGHRSTSARWCAPD